MSLAHAILAILNVSPLTGYDLKHVAFDQSVAHFWPADQAQIYRTLDRLADEGLVGFEAEAQPGDRLDKKTYHITDQGRAELRRWLLDDQPLPAYRDPFLIRLFFADQLSNEEIVGLIDGQIRSHRERLAALEGIPIPPPDADAMGDPRWRALRRLTLDLGLRLTRAYLDWLDQCRAVVEGLPEDR